MRTLAAAPPTASPARRPAGPCRSQAAAALLAGGLATAALAGTGDLPASEAVFADQVLAEANAQRQRMQLPALRTAQDLAALAADHSALMARRSQLGHDGFEARFARARRLTCVENLAAGYRSAAQLVAGWQASPSHHQNLLDARVQEVGVASVAGHVTWLACSAGTLPAR